MRKICGHFYVKFRVCKFRGCGAFRDTLLVCCTPLRKEYSAYVDGEEHISSKK